MNKPFETTTTNQNQFTVDSDATQAFCPPPELPLWSQHPRVYMSLDENGYAECPYCGNEFRKK